MALRSEGPREPQPSAEGRIEQVSKEALARAAELIVAAQGQVVALTGAGVSTDSGLPDFRSPGSGIWNEVDPQEVSSREALREDPARFWTFQRQRLSTRDGVEPNAVHRALATWEQDGLLKAIVTQNVDGLHQRAGSRHVLEMHGSRQTLRCDACGAEYLWEQVDDSADEDVPRCTACKKPHNVIRPNVVLFGEDLPPGALQTARALCWDARVLLCLGTSLGVWPVRDLPRDTLRAGGAVILINRETTNLSFYSGVLAFHDDLQCVLDQLGGAIEHSKRLS